MGVKVTKPVLVVKRRSRKSAGVKIKKKKKHRANMRCWMKGRYTPAKIE